MWGRSSPTYQTSEIKTRSFVSRELIPLGLLSSRSTVVCLCFIVTTILATPAASPPVVASGERSNNGTIMSVSSPLLRSLADACCVHGYARSERAGFKYLELREFSPQDSFNISELSEYRLVEPVFAQFARATQLIVTAAADDPRLAGDPLFTRDVAVLDDVVAAASRVEARLKFEPRYTSALRIAGISPHEYTKFALALFAARMAHGFLKSGAIRGVMKGVASDNVSFVAAHEDDVVALLRSLGVEAPHELELGRVPPARREGRSIHRR